MPRDSALATIKFTGSIFTPHWLPPCGATILTACSSAIASRI